MDAIDEELLGSCARTRAGFEAAVARLPAVVEDVHLTGGTDHQLRVACRRTSTAALRGGVGLPRR
jgi:hypothetical protein